MTDLSSHEPRLGAPAISGCRRAQVAAAIRELGHLYVERDPKDAELRVLHEELMRLADRLRRTARRPERHVLDILRDMPGPDPERGPLSHFQDCFVGGSQNPFGMSLEVFRHGDGVRGECWLGTAFEGAPGRAHGGVVAALFDDVFAHLTNAAGILAYTGELFVRYEAPVPVRVSLECRAEIDRQQGRKLVLSADLYDGTERVARGTGTFIVAPESGADEVPD